MTSGRTHPTQLKKHPLAMQIGQFWEMVWGQPELSGFSMGNGLKKRLKKQPTISILGARTVFEKKAATPKISLVCCCPFSGFRGWPNIINLRGPVKRRGMGRTSSAQATG